METSKEISAATWQALEPDEYVALRSCASARENLLLRQRIQDLEEQQIHLKLSHRLQAPDGAIEIDLVGGRARAVAPGNAQRGSKQ